MRQKTVTIFGSGEAKPGDASYEMARQLGGILARAGFTIVNGGYGGTMLAAAKAASQAGGKIIGVTCSAFAGSTANEFTTEQIVTGSLDERLNKLAELGDAYVVLPGGTGTLLELALVWELKNKGFQKAGKPVILVGEFWNPLVELIASQQPDSKGHIRQIDKVEQIENILADLQ